MKNEERIKVAQTILTTVIVILMVITLCVQIFNNHINYELIAFLMGCVVFFTGILMILDIIIKKIGDLVIHGSWFVLWLVNFLANLSKAL